MKTPRSTNPLLLTGQLILLMLILALPASAQQGGEQKSADEKKPDYLIARQDKDGNWFLGDPDAPVELVEFSDLQCPACASYHPYIMKMIKLYQGKVKFTYRHFPLISIHPKSPFASMAAEAAGRQGKFFEMVELLFEKQKEWGGAREPRLLFIDYAKELGLDTQQFQEDLFDEELVKKINRDLSEAREKNLNSTPSFFLNGERIVVRNPAELLEKIDQAIKEAEEE